MTALIAPEESFSVWSVIRQQRQKRQLWGEVS